MGAGTFVLAGLPLPVSAAAGEEIVAFTGGTEVRSGDIQLTAPEAVANGNAVPIEVSSDTAIEILLLAMGNSVPTVATFKFGTPAITRTVSTRIRLAGTQDVVAIARLRDGSFVQASRRVKVTTGCCEVALSRGNEGET